MKNIQNLLQLPAMKNEQLSRSEKYIRDNEDATTFFYEKQSEGVSDIFSKIRDTIIGNPADESCKPRKNAFRHRIYKDCV